VTFSNTGAAGWRQGHGDLGIFGHPTSRTPWLDKMASEGAKLTMYESGANVCSPSRASIMVPAACRCLSAEVRSCTARDKQVAVCYHARQTGRYYTRTGAWPGVFSPNSVSGLPLKEITVPKALKKAGYQSGMVGKYVSLCQPTCRVAG
jgi:arylsulfatase A